MQSSTALPATSVGLGFRVPLAADLLVSPGRVDFLEVVAEACFASVAARREAVALSRVWPVVPHGVKLSLGSAEGIDVERARCLGALARELRAPVVTEHVAFVRAGGREIGHLTQVPFTRASVRALARNVDAARRWLPDVPLLLENAAWTFRWPDDELDEATFFNELVEHTGCDLLLDLGNLYANAFNSGADPFTVLAAYPLDRVAMVHVAGGQSEDGFYFDTHAHPVPDRVFELYARLVERIGPVPVVLEHDDAFPPFEELACQLVRLKGMIARSGVHERAARPSACSLGPEAERSDRGEGSEGSLARAQADLAILLTDPDPAPAEAAPQLGERALARARDVLRKKRVANAWPLLPRLRSKRDTLRPLALACVGASPPACSFPNVADAIRIAAAASADPSLATDARIDLLMLRCRFVGSAERGRIRARRAPFVWRERLPGDRTVWVVKGAGASAPARLLEPRR
jgi:uncharacterized protein (UPF0276 family)